MTRRAFFLTLYVPPVGTKDAVANAGNEFIAQWKIWADRFNAVQPGTLDWQEAAAYAPLPRMFREFERRRDDWIGK